MDYSIKDNKSLYFVHSSISLWIIFWKSNSVDDSGPKTKTQISFCHWNLNGLTAHNFTKVSLLQALSVKHDYDIICLSETFLDSSISNDDERINIKG